MLKTTFMDMHESEILSGTLEGTICKHAELIPRAGMTLRVVVLCLIGRSSLVDAILSVSSLHHSLTRTRTRIRLYIVLVDDGVYSTLCYKSHA